MIFHNLRDLCAKGTDILACFSPIIKDSRLLTVIWDRAEADLMMACSDDGFSPMLLPCMIAALAIPIGLPVAMAGVLWLEREGPSRPLRHPKLQSKPRFT